jgi:endonuclease YncB( thermonuclease family)
LGEEVRIVDGRRRGNCRRGEESAEIARFLDSVHEGPAAFVLEGEAGIGKTTRWPSFRPTITGSTWRRTSGRLDSHYARRRCSTELDGADHRDVDRERLVLPLGEPDPTAASVQGGLAGAIMSEMAGRRFERPAVAAAVALALLATLVPSAATARTGLPVYRIDHVVDGDTVALRDGWRVRLVQIDTPEVYFGAECYGRAASRRTKTLLPTGTRVRLQPEPATDRVDRYGRLLRYVVRVSDGMNVNVRLVAVGAAAPYFYDGRRGRYANLLEALAKQARSKKFGLWGACPHTRYNPYAGIATRR